MITRNATTFQVIPNSPCLNKFIQFVSLIYKGKQICSDIETSKPVFASWLHSFQHQVHHNLPLPPLSIQPTHFRTCLTMTKPRTSVPCLAAVQQPNRTQPTRTRNTSRPISKQICYILRESFKLTVARGHKLSIN